MKKAFTLAEILLSMVIMGIIVGTLGKQYKETISATIHKQMTYAAYSLMNQNLREILATDATLPTTGADFCTKLSDYFNPITTDCSAAAATDGSDFNAITPNFIAPNGLTFYNVNTNPVIPNPVAAPTEGTYTFYIDIDGTEHGNNILNDDVLKFTTTLKGYFEPTSDSIAANNTVYLSANVYYKSGEVVTYIKQNIPFREAMCISGKNEDATYCTVSAGTKYTINTSCEVAGVTCDVEINDVSLAIKR